MLSKNESGKEAKGMMIHQKVSGSLTVEMAGVMEIVFFSMMVLLQVAFRVRAETVGEFRVHEEVERERHEIMHIEDEEISKEGQGQLWSLKVTAPVYRPEDYLRMWSLAENSTGTDSKQ